MPAPPFQLVGPDAAEVAKPEERGLRVTLPAKRTKLPAVGIQSKARLSGDFEVTGTYEVLAADLPGKDTGRFGVGVNLLISPGSGMQKIAKIAHFRLVQEGTGYVADFTLRGTPPTYRSQFTPTEARSGQLRLKREGATLRYLVADGPGGEFRELYKTEFGDEDIEFVRFVVNTGETPVAVDARLVDLRMRSGGPLPAGAADHEPAAPEPPKSRWKVWLAGAILGLVVTLALGVWLITRQRRRAGSVPAQAPAVSSTVLLTGPGCGKNLTARAEQAGKKLKCPQCAGPVVVPGPTESPS